MVDVARLADIKACLRGRRPQSLPVFCHSELFDLAQAGLTLRDAPANVDGVIEAKLRSINRYGWDWAYVRLHEAAELELLGLRLKWAGPYGPARPVEYAPLPEGCPDPHDSRQFSAVLEAISALRAVLGDGKLVCGRVLGPLSAAALAFGPRFASALARRDEAAATEAVGAAAELMARSALAQLEAGAHAIWINDAAAAAKRITAKVYECLAGQATRKLCQAIHEAGGIVLLHTADERPDCIRLQAECGPDAVCVGPGVDMVAIKPSPGGCLCLVGNLDPALLTKGGPAQVAAATEKIVTAAACRPVIPCTCGPVGPSARPENLRAFAETVRRLWPLLCGEVPEEGL